MSPPADTFLDGPLSGDAEPPDLVGQVLGEVWQVVRHIGEGSMGHVYEARHLEDGPARAAVKVLHTGLVADAEMSFRFRREADILEAIESPHVPRLFDRGRDPRGRPFFVLELLAGVDLSARIEAGGPLPFDLAVDVARKVAQALSAAHRAGVVHRDLKPENVMIIGGGSGLVVRVLDFSISKVEGMALTREGTILGTPAYMPPEQALGQPATPLVDVYAVGAVLYDMLTGQPPFDEGPPGKTLAAVLTKEAPRPRSLRADIPETLEAIVLTATAKKPEARYPTMVALEAALAAEAARLGVADVPEDAAPSTRRAGAMRVASVRPPPTAAADTPGAPASPSPGKRDALALGMVLTLAALTISLAAFTSHAVPLWGAVALAVSSACLGALWGRRSG